MKKYTIYNDDISDYINDNLQMIKESLIDNDIAINDDNIYKEATNYIDDDYRNFIYCLNEYDNKNKYDYILCVASLGLWYGRRAASKAFKDLKTAITFCFEDYNKVYFDKVNTTIKADAIHHDGTNIFTFYKVVNGKRKAIKYNDIISCY